MASKSVLYDLTDPKLDIDSIVFPDFTININQNFINVNPKINVKVEIGKFHTKETCNCKFPTDKQYVKKHIILYKDNVTKFVHFMTLLTAKIEPLLNNSKPKITSYGKCKFDDYLKEKSSNVIQFNVNDNSINIENNSICTINIYWWFMTNLKTNGFNQGGYALKIIYDDRKEKQQFIELHKFDEEYERLKEKYENKEQNNYIKKIDKKKTYFYKETDDIEL